MDAEESAEDDSPLHPYVHPDDRLWRHPSELRAFAPAVTLPRTAPAPRVWAVAAVAGLVGAVAATGVGIAAGDWTSHSTTVLAPVTRVVSPDTLASAAITSGGWPSIVDAVAPSVVSVTASSAGGQRSGSAVIYAPDGRRSVTYLLTDADLVESVGSVTATFVGGVAEPARVLERDPTTGLALLEVPGATHDGPTVGTVGNLREADAVVAVGGRSGASSGTVSASISGLGRSVEDVGAASTVCGLMAMSATLPTGDDGGAVVDQRGAVVGIVTGLTSNDPADAGMAFAVPIDAATHLAQQVLQGRRPAHPWVGITAANDLDSATARAMGVPGGAEVVDVGAGSPAARAGLRPDDVVTSLDGRPVISSGSLLSAVVQTTPGVSARIGYLRNGVGATASMTVAEQPVELLP